MSVSGKFLTCFVDGSELTGTHEWDVDENGDKLDKTTGSDRGRGNSDCGVIDTKVTVRFYLDIATGQYTRVRTGTVISALELFHNIDSPTPLYLIAGAVVLHSRVSGRVRDKMIVDCDIEAQGDVVTANDPS